HAARGCFHSAPFTALLLVLRVVGAVPVFLSRHWRDLSHLRLRVALFCAVAANAVGKYPDLPALYSYSHRGVCAASPTQGGGIPCRRSRRLKRRSIRGAISRASGSGAAITPRDSRSASISRPPTAAISCAPPARALTPSLSLPPT